MDIPWWGLIPFVVMLLCIAVLPLIGVFLIGSRHFIANIAAGAVKG